MQTNEESILIVNKKNKRKNSNEKDKEIKNYSLINKYIFNPFCIILFVILIILFIFCSTKIKSLFRQNETNISLSESSNYPSKWKKNNQGTFSYLTYEKLNSTIEKNLRGEKTTEIVKEAKNNISSENNFRKRELKLFPKKIIQIKDEYALEMVDKLFSRNQLSRHKMPGLKETVKERREMREHRFVNILRNRAKNNHDKIIRMGFYLAKEKEKFFIKNNKKHNKSNKKINNKEINNNNKLNYN